MPGPVSPRPTTALASASHGPVRWFAVLTAIGLLNASHLYLSELTNHYGGNLLLPTSPRLQ